MDDLDPLHWEGITLYGQGRYNEAEEILRRALEAEPSNVELICDIGECLESQGKLSEAEEAYRTALELYKTSQQAWYKLGAVLVHQENYREAIIAFERAIELLPYYVFSWEGYGYSLWKRGKIDESIIAFEKAIELSLDKSNSIACYHLGCLYFELGEYEKAEKVLLHLVDYGFRDYWNLLGKVFSKLGKSEEASDAFQKVFQEPE